MIKNKKGITLIALVVTIVVLLILAGVSISTLTGDSGIITNAQKSKLETRGGEVEEIVNLWKTENQLKDYTSTTVMTEEELIEDLKNKNLVLEEELDEENKIITIGSREIYYGLNYDKTSLKFLINSGDDGIVVMPIDADMLGVENGYTIDWGDGTTGDDGTVIANISNRVADLDGFKVASRQVYGVPHTYTEKNKEYVVTISGICQYINSYYGNVTREKIIEVLQWGETGLEQIYLYNCENLRKIASPSVNSFKYLYEYGLDCAFEWCTALTEIPSDLFANCPQIISFYLTFSGCKSLTSIPQNLFDNCQDVTDFEGTFNYCTGLTGEAPELWTRGTNTEENAYQGDPNGGRCFYRCTSLSNYEIIPDYWKSSIDS